MGGRVCERECAIRCELLSLAGDPCERLCPRRELRLLRELRIPEPAFFAFSDPIPPLFIWERASDTICGKRYNQDRVSESRIQNRPESQNRQNPKTGSLRALGIESFAYAFSEADSCHSGPLSFLQGTKDDSKRPLLPLLSLFGRHGKGTFTMPTVPTPPQVHPPPRYPPPTSHLPGTHPPGPTLRYPSPPRRTCRHRQRRTAQRQPLGLSVRGEVVRGEEASRPPLYRPCNRAERGGEVQGRLSALDRVLSNLYRGVY